MIVTNCYKKRCVFCVLPEDVRYVLRKELFMFSTVMKVCSFAIDAFKWTVGGASNNVKPLMLGLAVGTALWFGVGDLFAQETTSVSYEEIVSFDNIFDTIRSSIGGVVAGALGLGLAIWGARYVFHVIKSMGR